MMTALALMMQAVPLPIAACVNPKGQSAITHCAAERYKMADRELDAVWTQATSRARAEDQRNPAAQYGLPTVEQASLAAQRAWTLFREAECVVASQEMRGGSGAEEIKFECMERMTRARIQALHSGPEEN